MESKSQSGGESVPTEHVQTKREIAALLDEAGVRPRKRFGQHFLVDGNLMRRLAQSAELEPTDLVLEVGCGTGGLTDLIARRVRCVLGVEIDRTLHAILERRFLDTDGVTLILGDVLESKHRLDARVARALAQSPGQAHGMVKLVANLPYQVATPLLMNLLVDYPQVRRFCFTVQSEVGERLTAGPNRKAYGPLSIVVQLLSSVQTIARIPPGAFWPAPAVDSVMLRLDVQKAPFGDPAELRRFVALVRSTFEHRRKTLRAALSYVIDDEPLARACRCFDPKRRPESLRVDEWVALFHTLGPGSPGKPR